MGYSSNVLQHADKLVKIFGEGYVFFDDEIRSVYAHDLSNPPWVIDYLVKRQPDVVCVARTREQVLEVLKMASAYAIPVTPAAARSGAYGGAVPTRGGITLDVMRLNERVEVSKDDLSVSVDPGVIIWNLERELNRHGLMLCTYPTSAPSATIGGFVCQGGVGMGSFEQGPVADQVLEAELVTPDGQILNLTGRELDIVNECEGITGVVTRLRIRVRPLLEQIPVLATFDDAASVSKGAQLLADRHKPWNVTVHNPTFSRLREEAGGAKTVPKKKWSILAVFTQDDYDTEKDAVKTTLEEAGGKLLDEKTAWADWGEIFNTLRAKKLGPSIAPGEAVFPLGRMNEFLTAVEDKFGYADLSMELTLIQGGDVTMLAFALEDERRPEYPLGFAAGIGLLKVAKKHGGRAYSSGLYLASEAPTLMGPGRYNKLVAFKKRVDPRNVMNPGKIIGRRPRAKAWLLGIPSMPAPAGAPMSTVDKVLNSPPLTWGMSKVAPLMKFNRPTQERAARPAMFKAMAAVQGGAFGKKHSEAIYSCSQCGYCRDVSPLYHAVGVDAGSPTALIHQAKGYVRGQVEPSRKLADLLAAAEDTYVGDDVCPSGIPLSEVFRDWRKQMEKDLGFEFEAPASLVRRVKESEKQLDERAKRWASPVTVEPDSDAENGSSKAKDAPTKDPGEAGSKAKGGKAVGSKKAQAAAA